MAEIVFDHVTKVFRDGTVAVRDLSLEVDDGDLMILVGPSGCGKTTALRMVAGLEEISYGDIRIGDRIVNEIAPKERDIAMVFQNYALYPHLSVFDNIAFGLQLRHFKKPVVKERVEGAAKSLALFELLMRKRGSYRAGSVSASRWDALSSESQRPFSWTSLCRTSTPNCAFRCEARSRAFSETSELLRST